MAEENKTIAALKAELEHCKLLMHELHDSGQRYRAIVDSSDDAILSKDLYGRIISWNPGAERIFGYTAAEMIGQPVRKLIPPEHQDEEDRILATLRKGERVDHFETVRVHKDGSRLYMSVSISPIRNARGQVVGASKVGRDITVQRRATEQLKESEQKFTAIFQEAPIATVLIGMPDGQVLDANPAFVHFTQDSSPQSVKGSRALTDGLAMTKEEEGRILQQLTDKGKLRGMEVDIRNRNGRRVLVLNATLLSMEGGPRALLHVEDITVRKLSEEASEKIAQRKDEFLATLAHELRNPLAPLTNALQLLELATDDAAIGAQARAVMNRQLQQLVHLVDDLMDLSRVSRGAVELKRTPIDLRTAVVQAVEATRPMADQRGHTLKVEQAMLPLWVNGDNTRLVQVFSNLLNNAAKYTDQGGRITITSTARDGAAVVEITDNGTGIDPAHTGKVFDMFAQLENATTRKQGGLGIGLNIVKKMVTLHGGSISVHSEGLGKGSTFTVRIPFSTPPADTEEPVQDERHSRNKLRILVIDDNVESATSLSLLVRMMGHEARAMHNGHDGVVEVTSFKPDVVFLDIGMPGMDGYETCRCMRATPAGRNTHLVALTGWGQDEDKRLAVEAGFDRHVVKPLGREVLQNVLASVPVAAAGAV